MTTERSGHRGRGYDPFDGDRNAAGERRDARYGAAMEVSSIGKALIVIGIVVVVVGVLLVIGGGLGLGRLPGDFSIRRGNVRVFVPLATCLLLSLVISVVLTLLSRR